MQTTERKTPIVHVIHADVSIQTATHKGKKLRVAAYCRVSTDQDEQLSSYEAQVAYYTEKIKENSEWTLAGIFADEGISGTSAKKRAEFMRMIKLCEQGKIDMILTKSISRFARNTVDCLHYIRLLKERSIPVFFEKEGINTMTHESELILTFLGGFAQAESESISKNVTWGKRQAFKNGKVSFQYAKILGYEKGEDGKPSVELDQAAIVKRIYFSYLAGLSIGRIKAELESEGIFSPTGKIKWSMQNIQTILSNEKYIGDVLLQKTYVVDFLTKKTKKNSGEVQQYYVEDHHEAIIPREIFHKVQEETARRACRRGVAQNTVKTRKGKYSSKYALTELLRCGQCDTMYRRTTWAKNGKKKIVWRCVNRLEYGTKYCTHSPSIEEYILHDALTAAISTMSGQREEVISPLKKCFLSSLSTGHDGGRFEKKSRIVEIDGILADLKILNVNAGPSADYFDTKCIELLDEKHTLQQELELMAETQNTNIENKVLLDEIENLLGNADTEFGGYDDHRVRRLIESIQVVSAEKILVRFKVGIELEQLL